MALRFVDSNKIGMEQASKQAGVSMIMVRVWCPAQKQLSKINFEKKLNKLEKCNSRKQRVHICA